MNIVATIEEFEAFEMVNYYTIRLEFDDIPEENTEADKFLKKFMDDPEIPDPEAVLIYKLVEKIGREYGAREWYFRFENRIGALPPKKRIISELIIGSDANEFGEHPLRLYCSRINDQIVILFNGDRKTTLKVQDCPNVAGLFRQANKIQKQIDQDIRDGIIRIENGRLTIDDDYLILL